ncbi:MAG: cell envelope integrity protein CreD [Candidatus Falkowbacteria bacterium]
MDIKNMRSSLSVKLFVIGFLTALLMIPTGMIAVLVNDRENRQADAFREISEKWGLEQTVTGPILTVPYKTVTEIQVAGETRTSEQVRYAHFLPEKLEVNGTLNPETRKRGIYEVAVYTADLEIKGEFAAPDFSDWDIEAGNVMFDRAFVSLGLPDLRGIREEVTLDWNGSAAGFTPGLETSEVLASGMNARVDLRGKETGANKFSLKLKMNGSRDLMFTPVGKTTAVKLASAWPAPSFQGAFLPQYELSEEGFIADWKVLELNRSFPQKFLGTAPVTVQNQPFQEFREKPMSTAGSSGLYGADFGVRLLIPADEYQQTVRALKYAIMLLALTFLVLFFYEAKRDVRVHPLQYILIGLALSLFYVLLLSLAEYIGFNLAYLAAALAVTVQITLYSKAVFRAWRPATLEALILVFIYGFIFVILQLEDYALLAGSIGLFVILGLVMYVSRQIDWYRVNN